MSGQVALDNGRLQFAGSRDEFLDSGISADLVTADELEKLEPSETETPIESRSSTDAVLANVAAGVRNTEPESGGDSQDSTIANGSESEAKTAQQPKAPRKLIEEERRAVGRIARDIWITYLTACGGWPFWGLFGLALFLGAISPVLENGWLRYTFNKFHLPIQ
jgi:hypothetical protein